MAAEAAGRADTAGVQMVMGAVAVRSVHDLGENYPTRCDRVPLNRLKTLSSIALVPMRR